MDSLIYSVSPAERPDHALFPQRVLLLLPAPLHDASLTGGTRQPGAVTPPRMRRKVPVRVKPLPVTAFKHIFPVRRRGRPVHQLVRAVGAFIELVYPPFRRKEPWYGGIFIRRHVPCERDHHPHPRSLRRMPVGRVQAWGIRAEHLIAVYEANARMVGILRQHGAPFHRVPFAPPAFQLSPYKAALVLCPVTLGLRQLRVFLHCFRRPHRLWKALAQLVKGDLLVHPSFCMAATAIGDW